MNSPIAYLDTLLDHERVGMTEPPGLDGMRALLAAVGDPQTWFRSVHVTGTNGKGTVSATTAALLAERGLAVGTYTSPHVGRLAERVALQGRPVDDVDLEFALGVVRDAARVHGQQPTWFEALTAAAFRLFAEHRLDVAVIEVGMLGRWDATNVIDAEIAVVTNVALDHTELAGPSRADIAREKAGIVQPGSTLVLGESDPALRPIFAARSPARTVSVGEQLRIARCRITPLGSIVDLVTPRAEHRGIRVAGPGQHSCDNLLLAVAAAEEHLGSPLTGREIDRVGGRVRLPGRTEIVSRAPLVVLDGAHNPAALQALQQTIAELSHGPGPRVLVCGALRGHDVAAALGRIAEGFDRVIVCEPASPRAVPAAQLADGLGGARRAVVLADPAAASRAAVRAAGADGLVVVTGSMHLLRRAREGLGSVDTAAEPPGTGQDRT